MATTFADRLRSLSDEALGALIQLRPDLVVPVPSDLSALAVRAQSRGSVARCLDALDEFTLQILDAARLSRSPADATTSFDEILSLAAPGVAAEDVRVAVDRLRARFLLYGPEDALTVTGAVDEVTSPYPAGLGRPADYLDPEAAALCADRAKLRRTVLAAPPAARAVLDRLAAGPPIGALNSASMAEPVRWLIEHHVLVPVSDAGRAPRADGELVELPREVGLLLRRDTGPLGPLRPLPPAPVEPVRDVKAVDSAGAGQVLEAVRSTETLLDAIAAEPPAVLRTGGLGVRDLKRLARTAGVDEPSAAVLLEVAYAAGLLGEVDATGVSRAVAASRASGPVDDIFLPTGANDLWRALTIAQRWDRPGPGLAGDDPATGAGRRAGRPGPADQRPGAGGGTGRRTPGPPRDAGRAGRAGTGHRAGHRRRARAAGLAEPPPGAWPGGGSPRRADQFRGAGRDRARGDHVVQPGPDRGPGHRRHRPVGRTSGNRPGPAR